MGDNSNHRRMGIVLLGWLGRRWMKWRSGLAPQSIRSWRDNAGYAAGENAAESDTRHPLPLPSSPSSQQTKYDTAPYWEWIIGWARHRMHWRSCEWLPTKAPKNDMK